MSVSVQLLGGAGAQLRWRSHEQRPGRAETAPPISPPGSGGPRWGFGGRPGLGEGARPGCGSRLLRRPPASVALALAGFPLGHHLAEAARGVEVRPRAGLQAHPGHPASPGLGEDVAQQPARDPPASGGLRGVHGLDLAVAFRDPLQGPHRDDRLALPHRPEGDVRAPQGISVQGVSSPANAAIAAIVRWRLGSASVPQNASSETSPTNPGGAWAVAAGVLHFIPYLGPALTAIATGMAGFLQFESLSMALLVAMWREWLHDTSDVVVKSPDPNSANL